MGIFDLFKSKNNNIDEHFERASKKIFPKGQKDLDASVNELLRILDNKIDKSEATNIILKSIFISRTAKEFTSERLRLHLKPYALHHFDEGQFMLFWAYLIGLNAALTYDGKTPSEVRWTGSQYVW